MSQSQTTANTGTSSRNRHNREHDVGNPSSTASPRYAGDSEWETKEALRQRELEEARARAAQMEKTMRWWSDCTANWREKWSKVRNERNKSREEAKILRNKLEVAMKDANNFKHENQELEIRNEQLRKELQKLHLVLLKHAGQFDRQIVAILESDPELRRALGVNELLEVYNNVEQCEREILMNSPKDSMTRRSPEEETLTNLEHRNTPPNRDIEEYVLQGAVPKHAVELYKDSPMGSLDRDIANLLVENNETNIATNSPELFVESPVASLDRDIAKLIAESNEIQDKNEKRQSALDISNDEYLMQKMSMLNLRLEEATRTISAEREEKSSLHRGMEKLRSETIQLRERCEELQKSRAEAIQELMEMRERFQTELSAAQADLIDEASNREGMDQRLCELRTELERLQAENAAEWGKRERLESEKISLERENKKLKNEIRELQERNESRRGRPISTVHTDSSQEIVDRSKELSDLKHSYSKLKKVLAEKTTELSHALRRSEQYEAEVKRVRSRVDELKRELSGAQDEVDAATNSVRRLQRANEDLIEQLESANVQIEHFKNSSDNCASEVGTETTDGRERDDDDNDGSIDDYESHRV
ncbi:coiled-coil domain-containing protein 102A isoform X2 [Venturia canescens]|nr:coiled-coil domain-containing protein 102A isoform X2 [Venturia canescens]XP_043286346.1 coiled-coil domain-containing protein 102A isoform X2 [Venturia canescens]